MKYDDRKRLVLISIESEYANMIFEELVNYEYRYEAIDKSLLNDKIYIYSSREDKAIIGYVRVSNVKKVSRLDIVHLKEYEIVNRRCMFTRDHSCYQMELYDVCEFDEYLSLKYLRIFQKSVSFNKNCTVIYEDNPLYQLILEWDRAYSLDGEVNKSDSKVKSLIRKRQNDLRGNNSFNKK